MGKWSSCAFTIEYKKMFLAAMDREADNTEETTAVIDKPVGDAYITNQDWRDVRAMLEAYSEANDQLPEGDNESWMDDKRDTLAAIESDYQINLEAWQIKQAELQDINDQLIAGVAPEELPLLQSRKASLEADLDDLEAQMQLSNRSLQDLNEEVSDQLISIELAVAEIEGEAPDREEVGNTSVTIAGPETQC